MGWRAAPLVLLVLGGCQGTKDPAEGQPGCPGPTPCGLGETGDGADYNSDTANPDEDLDGDGYAGTDDCDDHDATVSPAAVEIPYDGVDNDCDPSTPDDDLDGDGYARTDDCDDEDASVYPRSGFDCMALADADLKLIGEAAGDDAGYAVALGDLDGDGSTDVAVGAPGFSTGSADSGRLYIVSGRSRGTAQLADADELIIGRQQLGSALGVADITGDGQDDLIVGAQSEDDGFGAIYLLLGPLNAATRMTDAIRLDASWIGASDALGRSVGTGGDVNGDGVADVIVGSRGTLLYGWSGDSPDRPCRLRIEEGQGGGSALGDLSGDGLADLVVADQEYGYPDSTGAVFIFVDPSSYADSCVDAISTRTASRISGNSGTSLARSVGAGADVDGDGYGDLVVSDPDGVLGPSIYLFSGPITADAALLDATARIEGDSFLSFAGGATELEDMDGDGRADVVLGDTSLGLATGRTWIAFGPLAGSVSLARDAASLIGEEEGDRAGRSLAAGGVGTLAVGAPAQGEGGAAGTAYVFFGGGD